MSCHVMLAAGLYCGLIPEGAVSFENIGFLARVHRCSPLRILSQVNHVNNFEIREESTNNGERQIFTEDERHQGKRDPRLQASIDY